SRNLQSPSNAGVSASLPRKALLLICVIWTVNVSPELLIVAKNVSLTQSPTRRPPIFSCNSGSSIPCRKRISSMFSRRTEHRLPLALGEFRDSTTPGPAGSKPFSPPPSRPTPSLRSSALEEGRNRWDDRTPVNVTPQHAEVESLATAKPPAADPSRMV